MELIETTETWEEKWAREQRENQLAKAPSLVEGLRSAADWFERHPEYAPVYTTVTLNIFADSKEELAKVARAMGRAEKKVDENYFMLAKSFSPLVVLEANVARGEVCRRVVTGVEEVVVEAKPAEPERVEEREIVEWVCDDPVLAAVAEVPA